MTAAQTYAALIDAVHAQRSRIHGQQPVEDRFGGPVAQRFRADPHRSLDANLQVVASYVQPDDVFIDVGGGAGRVGLPLALRCRQVTTSTPLPACSPSLRRVRPRRASPTSALSWLTGWQPQALLGTNLRNALLVHCHS